MTLEQLFREQRCTKAEREALVTMLAVIRIRRLPRKIRQLLTYSVH